MVGFLHFQGHRDSDHLLYSNIRSHMLTLQSLSGLLGLKSRLR